MHWCCSSRPQAARGAKAPNQSARTEVASRGGGGGLQQPQPLDLSILDTRPVWQLPLPP